MIKSINQFLICNCSKVIFVLFIFPIFTFGQSDTSLVNLNKLFLNPNIFGYQIEATSILAINELGFNIDYDIYSSINKKHNIGLRLSTEYYKIHDLDFGGGSTFGPYWDFSLFARHSIRGYHFWFSPLLGLSLHNNLQENSSGPDLLFKWGLELKYNVVEENAGLLLKFVGSSIENSSYGGIGISIGIYNK